MMSIYLIDGWYDLHRTKGYEKKSQNDKVFGSKITENEAKKCHIDLSIKCFGYVFASSFRKMFMPSEKVIEGVVNGNIYNVIIGDKITKTINGQRNKSEYVCYLDDRKWFNLEGEVTRREFYQNNVKVDFRVPALVELIQKECFKNEMLFEIEKYIIKIKTDKNTETCNIVRDRLIALLNGVNGYDEYSTKLMIKFLSLLNSSDSNEKWIQAIYYYIYFSFTMQVHRDIGFKSYERYYEDRQEYIKEVIDANNDRGILTNTLNLTLRKTPNVYALYVLSEEYMRRGEYNFQYDIMRNALEINPDHPQINYMMAKLIYDYPKKIRYKVRIAKLEKRYCISEDKYCMKQCLDIISYLERSCRMQYAPAFELFGDILQLSDKCFPYKGNSIIRNAISFYEKSIENGNNSSYWKKARVLFKQCYESKFINLKVFNEGLRILDVGAENNDYSCLKYLGFIYYYGIEGYIEEKMVVGLEYWIRAAFCIPQVMQVFDSFEVLITLLGVEEGKKLVISKGVNIENYLEVPVVFFEEMSKCNEMNAKTLSLCKKLLMVLESFHTEKYDLFYERVAEVLRYNEM